MLAMLSHVDIKPGIPQGTFLKATQISQILWIFGTSTKYVSLKFSENSIVTRIAEDYRFPNLYIMCMKVPKHLLTYSNYPISSYS